MNAGKTYQVRELARMANTTVRTLHHYDHLGLLRPSRRTEAGYRLYTTQDLLRLQQILLYRAQGLPLARIQKLLDDLAFNLRQALLQQRQALQQQAQQTAARLRAINHALRSLDTTQEADMNGEDLFEGFDPTEHEQEAHQRWGDTPAWAQSRQRTARYTPQDWEKIKHESEQIFRDLAALMGQGADPASPQARVLAEAHRAHISRWFYDCDLAMHRDLADMWEQDARFAANIDKFAPGLTPFAAAAARANADADA